MANSSLNSLADYSSSDDEEVLHLPKTRCVRQSFFTSPKPNQSDDDSLPSSEGEDEQSQPQPSTSDHDLAAQSHEIPDGESEEDSVSTPAKRKRSTAYALPMDQLPGPLQKFLETVKKFFMQKVNFQRQTAPISITTYAKAQERMLCYLGYVRSTLAADKPFTEDCFLNIPTIEAYVDFLKEERNASSATCGNHLSSLLYALKFLHRENGPEFKDIQIIKQIRAQATILHKQGDIERPSTKEDLEALNRWISWDEVVCAVTAQRQRFESTHPLKLKAWHCSDLVLLSLYVYLPPSRGLEVRTLEIVRDRSKLDARNSCDRNFLVVDEDGSGLRLQINRYKTQRFRGRDEVAIQPGDELCRVIKTYIDNYRPQLITELSGDFLLVVSW